MEMMVTQSGGAQSQFQPSIQAGTAKGQAGGGFQQALVQQIGGATGETAAAATTAQPLIYSTIAAAGQGAAESGEMVQLTLSDLMAIIDDLIDQLGTPLDSEQSAEDGATEEQLAPLEAGLEQITSLLAVLGMPIALNQQLPGASAEGDGQALPAAEQAASLRNQLQDQLLQLQALLQQGNTKRIQQQDPLVMVSKQLEAFTALLTGEHSSEQSKPAKPEGFQQLFVAQADVVPKDAGGLLQRLNSQAAHPALWSGAANVDAAIAGHDNIQPVASETTTVSLGAHSFDNQRALTQLIANAAPAATTYVAADDFAKSMTGLIVQKFDLTTLNGVSEAKLMLFPEHLGQVDVKITMQNGLLTAIFQTDTAMAKDMLDNQMAQLRLALQSQGLNVDKLEVSQGQSASQLAGQHQGQSGQQQHSSRNSSAGDNGSIDTNFEAEIVEQAAAQGLGYGRAINVKA
jgi:flagellar hook-length control protein FliK